ncbi:indolepyruvate ferredoxin oxidoreductase family protein [Sphingomonas gei]|uniref:Indolepyruvate ferredoxin oxidoreductase family protein n=1 Tax=Sphingomonas gei TaxID=1395960 RepID=A0A4S1X0J2_9SPHN|nr:indolepyruvate ferredoxin oxidoreductase family protein [Sphingomonas gei]TGX48745.1 indolepyruvate ferredoxin oxidoreductase family protein [Sphingomonas gei]
MSTDAICLENRYRLDAGRVLISGAQALVRLPIVQRALDRRQGLNTAGYISGYRGSPLGGYDDALWKAADALAESGIVFHPGVNEDLALTAVAGTQQIDFIPGKRVDGVFALWYGKGPGVDRSGDAIKHANLHGVSPQGGVVLIYGDDHTGKSSTTAHQSDLTLASWGVPTLYPSNVTEILQMGLAAIAMSRHSGLLVGLKLVNETAEATEAVDLLPPPDFVLPEASEVEGGVHIRPEVMATQRQDARLVRHKLPMAAAFARANRLDRIALGAEQPEFLIGTAGKAYPDVIAALDLLGIDDAAARRLGIGVYKIALLYPLDPAGLQDAAAQAREICFVEEKRPHAETQAMAQLYALERRPRITGKRKPDGSALLPEDMPLDATIVALALAERLDANFPGIAKQVPAFAEAAGTLRARFADVRPQLPVAARRPAFCPGCPHNLSTKVPHGSFGATGIGCHSMALFHPERNPIPMGHMGAEGANWIGLSAFTDTQHIFQNLGDGTYNHSGSLAIRAAVRAGTTITYKILFNDAVAMTGGQPVEGDLTVARIVEQVRAEGVERIVVLSEDPDRFAEEPLPRGTELRHRDELALAQKALREVPGVTVLIYDQVCAAEKRRRRKIGAFPDPDRRTFINALVCEGCGDCSTVSNCLAIQPLETELGRKRRIDQSACNKDFSCVAGFCPSFVTVEGGKPRKAPRETAGADAALPDPIFRVAADHFDMMIAGIGGTGVVTIGAVLGMAAQIDGLHANLFDMTGLSQKGGAVFSHVRLRRDPAAVVSAKIGTREADLVLGCDLIAAVHPEVLSTIAEGSLVIGNSDTSATATFQTNRDAAIDPAALLAPLTAAAGEPPATLHASQLATRLFGDSIGANMILLGFAWQRGGVPLSRAAIVKAIELNKRAVASNLAAFEAGRRAALEVPEPEVAAETLDAFLQRRSEDLTQYWNARYARRFDDLMARIRTASDTVPGGEDFAWATARSAFKLMAYKDEYEVGRLYTDGRFRAALEGEFEGTRALKVHLAPPILSRIDPRTGHPRKRSFGAWIFPLLSLLAALKPLRETLFDPFGRTAERRLERDLRDAYLARVEALCAALAPDTLADAVRIARAPLAVRGFGHVKAPAAEALLAELRG